MDLEQRVQVLEQEVQVLKNQIQATLLEMQEYLLTNAHPSLRAEDTPRSSSARPQPGALRKVSFTDNDDDERDDEPRIAGVRKVSLNAEDEPAPRKSNGKRKAARSDDEDEPDAPRKPAGVRKVSLEDVDRDESRPKKQSVRAADWNDQEEPAPQPAKAAGKRPSQPKNNGHVAEAEADELPGITFYQAEPVEPRKPRASRTMEAPAEPHRNGTSNSNGNGKHPASQAMAAKPAASKNGSKGKPDPLLAEDDIDHSKKTVLRLIAGLYNAGAGVNKKDK
ncbi:MAG: hypothetical protein IT324_03220 [Anaerolineae bacterium]|nr:hypothetical protein [Anaerolineae bacterium]